MNVHWPIAEFTCISEIPTQNLNERRFPVYVIDYEWKYVFLNKAAKHNLAGVEIEGCTIQEVWEKLPHLNFQTAFYQIKDFVEKRQPMALRITSPISKKLIEIIGKPLHDCYVFSISDVPDKESLLNELRAIVKKNP